MKQKFNNRYQTKCFSLKETAETLLGADLKTGHHTAVDDAMNSMLLYRQYCQPTFESRASLDRAKGKLNDLPSTPRSVSIEYPKGCCCAGYSKTRCSCGQKLLSDIKIEMHRENDLFTGEEASAELFTGGQLRRLQEMRRNGVR